MKSKEPRRGDERILTALACGVTVDNAAKACGVSDRTIYRRLKDPKFRRRLRELRSEILQRSAGMLTAASVEGTRTLLTLLRDQSPPAVRLGAARAVLEIGIKVREAADLADRVTALEEHLSLKPPGES